MLNLAALTGSTRWDHKALAFGSLTPGKIANLLSDTLVLGFTGAAILIVFSQLPKALGVETSDGGVIRRVLMPFAHPTEWHGLAILFFHRNYPAYVWRQKVP